MTVWVSRRHRLAVAGLLILFFLLATVYNATSPPFEAPDEIGHFYYVVHLLQNHRLPVVPASGPPPHCEHEGIQPPLYYAGAALFVRALSAPLRLDLVDVSAPLEGNPHSTCAQPGARYNITYFAHDPHQERFPYAGRVRMLHVVRLWSSLLGMATVAGVFAAVRLAFPGAPAAAWLAAGLTACTPTFLFTAGAVSNDNLVTALTTWGIVLTLRLLRDGLYWPHTLALGSLAGLAALSKFSGALLLPLALVVIPLAAALRQPKLPHRRHPFSRWTPVIGHCSLLVFPFLAIAGWWFLRNWTLYGDLTGTRPMLEMLPLRREMSVMVLIRELPGLFRSWWGAFGCTAPPIGFHLIYLVPVLGGLAGLAADRRELGRTWPQVGVLLAWLGLMGVAYVRWNWVIHASKGRLLYPAMVSVAGFLGRGWATWSARHRWLAPALLVPLALGAAVVPVAVIAPRVFPPPIYATVADVQPQHVLDGRFGSEIALLGYDLDGTSFEPGEWLDLTLYWHVLDQPAEHYVLAIQLVSAVPGETATLINFNTWTGGGSYPTGYWHPGAVIADRYRLRTPDDVVRAQGWYVQVVLYDGSDGDRLPFALDGQPVGKTGVLTLLRVGTANPGTQAPPEADRLAAPIHFDGAVALDGVRVTGEGEALDVVFWWRSVAPLAGDYVVFVHLYDADGQLVAIADAPPLSGGFPTSMWRPGDRVRDARTVSLPGEANAPFRIDVGWYDPVTGVRLPATGGDGVRLTDDIVRIPTSR
jgi:hypothetical protein